MSLDRRPSSSTTAGTTVPTTSTRSPGQFAPRAPELSSARHLETARLFVAYGQRCGNSFGQRGSTRLVGADRGGDGRPVAGDGALEHGQRLVGPPSLLEQVGEPPRGLREVRPAVALERVHGELEQAECSLAVPARLEDLTEQQ